MKKTRLQRHIVLCIIAILGIVGALFGMRYLLRYLHAQETQVLSAQQRVASYEQNKKIFSNEYEALMSLRERIGVLEGYVVTEATVPALLSTFEELALTRNVSFDIVSAQNPGTQKTERLMIDFSASGSEADVLLFLEELTQQTYQLKFTKLSLFSDTKPRQWRATGSIQVISFGI